MQTSDDNKMQTIDELSKFNLHGNCTVKVESQYDQFRAGIFNTHDPDSVIMERLYNSDATNKFVIRVNLPNKILVVEPYNSDTIEASVEMMMHNNPVKSISNYKKSGVVNNTSEQTSTENTSSIWSFWNKTTELYKWMIYAIGALLVALIAIILFMVFRKKTPVSILEMPGITDYDF